MGTNRVPMFAFLIFVVLQGWPLDSALAAVHRHTFILQEKNFTKLCGPSMSRLTVNGSIPGPELHVERGDTAFITVVNKGTYGVTIHWHGVKQPRNPWSDGPENVTQCPIQPGTSFTQEIVFSDEEGTLWWHAHSDWSRATVHGAIIIHPKKGTNYPYPIQPVESKTLILGEWYQGDIMAFFEEAMAVGSGFPISDAYTINGEPGDLYDCSNTSTYRVMVDYGKTYLLRIISAVMDETLFFGIANHTLKVVGMDGAYLKPIDVKYIMITPGQTMDVLVTANQAASHYYMETNPFGEPPPPFDTTHTTATLVYRGRYAPPATPYHPTLPDSTNTTAALSFTRQLRSLADKRHPCAVPNNRRNRRRIFMTVSINHIACPAGTTCGGPGGQIAAASLTNITFSTPTTDILQAYYSKLPGVFSTNFPDNPPYQYNYTGDVGDNTLYPTVGTEVMMIEYGTEVEIVWQGTNVNAPEMHPMHLHGYSFYVIATGEGNFNETSRTVPFNERDPPQVNTVGVPKNGWVLIRFKADNPGVWFMHCHFEKHAAWGMAMTLIVKNGPTPATSMRPKPSGMPSCSGTQLRASE